VGPVYSGKPRDKTLLTGCYRNSLQLAADNNFTSIAFPAISCGVYGYPIEKACKIAVDTTGTFLKTTPSITRVIFMLFSPVNLNVYEEYLHRATRNIDH
jgi:O-acetyl-ADP-ribose deacetylase (regulator of RNase III)